MAARILPQDFYVYIHRRASNQLPFYVGKGKGARAWVSGKTQRSEHWHRVVAKHGLIVEIFQQGMQEWWAHEVECELIALYGRGQLINRTDGGDGVSGAKLRRTKEWAEKISRSKKGKTFSEQAKINIGNAIRGRKHAPETLAKMSISRRMRPPVSDETRRKMSESAKRKVCNLEAIKKTALKNKGKKRTPEFCSLMKEIQNRRWEKIKSQQSQKQYILDF